MTQYTSAGDTWRDGWQELIENLSRRSKTNRAERGYGYYIDGAVRDVEWTVSSVYAKVVSSSGGFYLVTIQIRPFAAGVWNRFFNLLARHGELSEILMRGELSTGMETLFAELGVQLLPAAREVDVSCDCPDSAVPCKHGFALLFHLLEEIELNPLRLVLLRGMPESIWFERIGQSHARGKHTVSDPLDPVSTAHGAGDGASGGGAVPGAGSATFLTAASTAAIGTAPSVSAGVTAVDATDTPFSHLPWVRHPEAHGVAPSRHAVQSAPPAALKPVQALWHRARENTYWFGSAPAGEEGMQLANWHPLNISVFEDARSQFAVHRFSKPPFPLPRQDAMTELRDAYRQVSEAAAAILREDLGAKITADDED